MMHHTIKLGTDVNVCLDQQILQDRLIKNTTHLPDAVDVCII
jgi:hypothetical protein